MGRSIAGRLVFNQGVLEQCLDAVTLPIHGVGGSQFVVLSSQLSVESFQLHPQTPVILNVVKDLRLFLV
jgi:hypothetical protein